MTTLDDYSQDTTTKGALTIANPVAVTGVLETKTDKDWFAVQLNAGDIYQFTLSGAGNVNSDAATLVLHDAAGKKIAVNYSAAPDNLFANFAAKLTGTYYVEVMFKYAYYNHNPRDYSLSVALLPADDYPNNASTSAELVLGNPNTFSSFSGRFDTNKDTDWIAVQLKAGHEYSFSVQNAGSINLGLIAPNKHDYYSNIADVKPLSSGTYYLSVFNTYQQIGAYTIKGMEYQDDYGADSSTTGLLAIPAVANTSVTVSGVSGLGADVDWFAMQLQQGSAYIINLTGATKSVNLNFYELDSTGKAVLSNNVSAINHAFSPEKTGTYYAAVTSADGNHISAYNLNASVYVDDFANNSATTGQLVLANNAGVSRSVTGTLGIYGDSDWFAVNLNAGSSYQFTTDKYHRVNVLSATGAWLTDDIVSPEKSGTYYVEVTDGDLGSYTLSASRYRDDYRNDSQTIGVLPINASAQTSVTGKIEVYTDKDWLAVQLQAGQSYEFSQTGGDYSSHLQLVNGAGDALTTHAQTVYTTQGVINRLSFSPTEAATYYLQVSEDSGAAYNYTLTANQYTDDYAANTATRGHLDVSALALPSAVAGMFEVVSDSDWFAVNLQATGAYAFTVNNGNTVTLYNSAGEVINNGSKTLAVIAPSSDTYYVSVSQAYYATTPSSYQLSAEQLADDYRNDSQTTGLLTFTSVTSALKGNIDIQGDKDWFAMSLQAGKSYSFRANVTLTVVDAQGNALSSPNSNTTFTAASDATYYLQASSSNRLGSYNVIASKVAPLVLLGNEHASSVQTLSGDWWASNSYDVLTAFPQGRSRLVGNGGNDSLYGGEDNDTLDGGTGSDLMQGGAGNDSYIVDNAGDVIIENFNAGKDSVNSGIDYTLGAHLENLLTDAANATGNELNNVISDVSPNNATVLQGMAGNDTLKAGNGADTLIGGEGKDVINLTEYVPASDVLRVAQGESMVNAYDVVQGFELSKANPSAPFDKLDLGGAIIAADTGSVDGINYRALHSHQIKNGIISFAPQDNVTTPLDTNRLKLNDIFHYLQNNLNAPQETVAFVQKNNTYVFENNDSNDTLVELTGVVASHLSNANLALGAVVVQ